MNYLVLVNAVGRVFHKFPKSLCSPSRVTGLPGHFIWQTLWMVRRHGPFETGRVLLEQFFGSEVEAIFAS